MFHMNRISLIFLLLLPLSMSSVRAENISGGKEALQLSPELLVLLRAEMREILTAVQSLPVGIATADWKSVADTSAQIRASYILEQKLTPEQRQELTTSLPEHFKRLDSHFHLEAQKLEKAAINHDPQLSAFHYYRMLETCTACHKSYAPSRFPGFSSNSKQSHGH
jgi:hypothetical protein